MTIFIVCSSGLTSTLLARKLNDLLPEHYKAEGLAIELVINSTDADLIFLAPQYSDKIELLQQKTKAKITLLPPNHYNLDHLAELKFIIEKLGSELK